MKSWHALLLVGAISLAAPSVAMAGPAPSVTAILACDRSVGAATVHVDFQVSLFNPTVVGSADLSCGPDSVSGLRTDRQKIVTTGVARWANVTTSIVVDGAGSGGCPGGGQLTFKDSCRGATLTVR